MNYLLAGFFLMCQLQVHSQLKYTTTNVGLVKLIEAKKYAGKQFQLVVDIKSQPADSISGSAIMSLQTKKQDWDYINSARQGAMVPSGTAGWNTYTVSGTIDAEAHKIWAMLVTYGNGDFWFDAVRFKIKEGEGWTDIPVENGDFEKSPAQNPLKGFKNTESATKKGVTASLEKESGRGQFLHIHAEGGTIVKRALYGNNAEAGSYVTSAGTKIYYEIYGQGEPLLLLHGNGGSISSFAGQIEAFSKNYKVIAVDTRGQGKSLDTTTSYFSYNQFADDMKVLLDSLHLKQVSLVGWSDGGNTGLLLASKYPGYVKKLVTMGANLNPSDKALDKKILKQVAKDLKEMKAQKDADPVVIRLMEMLLKEPNISPESLGTITAQTLVMAGEHDLILEEHTRLIAASIPGAQLLLLKGQTHNVVADNPELFNKEVLEFLKK